MVVQENPPRPAVSGKETTQEILELDDEVTEDTQLTALIQELKANIDDPEKNWSLLNEIARYLLDKDTKKIKPEIIQELKRLLKIIINNPVEIPQNRRTEFQNAENFIYYL